MQTAARCNTSLSHDQGMKVSLNVTRTLGVGLIALALSACSGGGGAERFSSRVGSESGSSGGRADSACITLREYAFEGIPATYIDDGADLLYLLAGAFSMEGRNDIANSIERVVDLTYQGPYGQMTAKSELMNLANQYC
jgi:hypothetical protein